MALSTLHNDEMIEKLSRPAFLLAKRFILLLRLYLL